MAEEANGPNFDGNLPLDLGHVSQQNSSLSGLAAENSSPVGAEADSHDFDGLGLSGAIGAGPSSSLNNPILPHQPGQQLNMKSTGLQPVKPKPVDEASEIFTAADLLTGSNNSVINSNTQGNVKPQPPKVQQAQPSQQQQPPKDLVKPADQIGSQESDSFYKMYNKEIKVNQDEIPIILAELTDAAFNFIQRENYEKALVLLQKTEGVLEVVSLEGCVRDKYVSFITYNNMSMCFQKLGMLDECIFYLKQSIALVSEPKFYKCKRISQRNRRVNHECKLKLQLCAILSQNQNHSEALENARKSVHLSHQMFKDMEELCQIYIDKINYRDNLLAAQEQSDLEDAERVQLVSMVLESTPAREIPKNFLEQSISLVERSSLKMHPVVREVRRRVVNSEIPAKEEAKEPNSANLQQSNSFEVEKTTTNQNNDEDGDEEEKPDMRSVLGFLNQNEWIYNLNIGNIMQIQPLAMKEFLHDSSDEYELGRDSFLSKLSILIVTYFCMSTEMRFLLQSRAAYLKPEVKKERELESEFWHAKALEIACTFLPSECPLLNHVLLSYQKNHDPTMQPIKEDEESNDVLSVLRPLKGIDQSKYQPIVRQLPQVKVNMSPEMLYTPLKKVLQQFDQELVDQVLNFNATKVKKVTDQTDKEVQVAFLMNHTSEIGNMNNNNNSPTQANLSAIIIPTKLGGQQNYNESSMTGQILDDSAVEIIHGVDNRILPLSLNDSRVDGLESAQNMSNNERESQKTSTQKLKDEMKYLQEQSMSLLKDNDEDPLTNNGASMDNLEKQILEAAADSPVRDNRNVGVGGVIESSKFQFDSRDDSFAALDSAQEESNEGTQDGSGKMYDLIISRVLNNPKIDKKILLQKFISTIEMESNLNAGISSEISTIKELMSKESGVLGNNSLGGVGGVIDIANQHANSQHISSNGHEAVQKLSLKQQISNSNENQNHPGGKDQQAQSMKLIKPSKGGLEAVEQEDSEILLNVPSETMAGQTGVQDARISRDRKQIHQRHQHGKSSTGKGSNLAAHHSQGRDVKNTRITNDTSMRTRSSSHNHMRGHKKNQNQLRQPPSSSNENQKEFRGKVQKMKRYLEDEQSSLFKDIERSAELYYQDPLNLNVESAHTDTAPVDVEDIQLIERESSPSDRSRGGKRGDRRAAQRHHQTSIQSTENHQHKRLKRVETHLSSSAKKSQTQHSRPSTAVTNATRHSSVNLQRGRRRRQAQQNQQAAAPANNPQKTLVAKELEREQQQQDMTGIRSRSESSSAGRFQKQARHSRELESHHGSAGIGSSFNHQIVSSGNNTKSNQRLKHSQARKRLSVNQQQQQQQQLNQHMQHQHGQSVEHQPADGGRIFGKASQKRNAPNRLHNMSVQQTQGPSSGFQNPQHHLTSKIKKLVSHKQIETKRQSKQNKQKQLSQTKNVLQYNRVQANNNFNQPARGRSTRQRKNNSKSKSKSKSKSRSHSRSSGQRTYSGSSHHLKSRSNKGRSGSDNRRNFHHDLPNQYSFDLIDGEQVNINAISAQQLMADHKSMSNLQRQVLENQKTILGLLNNNGKIMPRKRAGSNDSQTQVQAMVGNNATKQSVNLRIKKQIQNHPTQPHEVLQGSGSGEDPGQVFQRLSQSLSQQQHQNQKYLLHQQQSQNAAAAAVAASNANQVFLHAQPLPSESADLGMMDQDQLQQAAATAAKVPAFRVNKQGQQSQPTMQNSASQHVQGLSNFIKQISSTSKRNDQFVNKSINYLKKQQAKGSSTAAATGGKSGNSQPPRSKATCKKGGTSGLLTAALTNINQQPHPSQASQLRMDQGKFKQSLMQEIRTLQSRLKEHIKQANESSPIRDRSGSQKYSGGGGDRSQTRSRSRSPTQPTKAIIPKKKSFNQLMQHNKNMNFTTNEVKQQLSESLLNISSGDQLKQQNRTHATSKIAKRKIENLIQGQVQLKQQVAGDSNQNMQNGNNLAAYNSFEEVVLDTDMSGNRQLAMHGHNNAHHSLSMFDSDANLNNQVNQFAPLHHQLSQNAILAAPQTLSQNYILGNSISGGTSKQQRIVGGGENQPARNHSQTRQDRGAGAQKGNKSSQSKQQRLQQAHIGGGASNAGGNYRTNPMIPPKPKLNNKN